MLSREEVLERLKLAKQQLSKQYPIKILGLFGSYARNEQTPESDIDIAIDFTEPIGWEIGELASQLDAIFGQEIDLLTLKGIKNKNIEPYILEDLIYV